MTNYNDHQEKQVFLARRHKRKIHGLRHVLLILGSLISAMGISCVFALNYATACDTNSTDVSRALYEIDPYNSPVMHFEPTDIKLNYSAYNMGMLAALIIQILWKKYYSLSTRWTVTIGSAISSIITLIIPISYDLFLPAVFVLKVIQGFFIATTIPLTAQITSHWSPQYQIGLFIGVMNAYAQVGLFIVMFTAGPLCTFWGWRSIFYVMGSLSTIITILWFLLYRDDPTEHPFISQKELTMITSSSIMHSKENSKEIKTEPPPYKKMFTNRSVIACFIACTSNFWGISTIIISFALIMKRGLGLTDIEASFAIGCSGALQLATKLISGKLSDILKLSENIKVRIFNSLSCGLCGAMMIITAILPDSNKMLLAVLICVFHGIIGLNAAGFIKAYVLVAKQHSSVMFTCNGLILNVTNLLLPYLSFWIAPQSSWNQWKKLLIFHGSIVFIGNLLFCLMVDARPAKFTESKSKKKNVDEAHE